MGNARSKLNVAHVNGCLLISAVLGWLAGSWTAFLVALAISVGLCIGDGSIRPSAGKR